MFNFCGRDPEADDDWPPFLDLEAFAAAASGFIASVVPAADGKTTNDGDGTEEEYGNYDEPLDGELGDFSEKGHGPLPVGHRRAAARPLHGLTQPARC